jgi:hypothetical protein
VEQNLCLLAQHSCSHTLFFFLRNVVTENKTPPKGHEEQEIIVIEEPHARDAATRAGIL